MDGFTKQPEKREEARVQALTMKNSLPSDSTVESTKSGNRELKDGVLPNTTINETQLPNEKSERTGSNSVHEKLEIEDDYSNPDHKLEKIELHHEIDIKSEEDSDDSIMLDEEDIKTEGETCYGSNKDKNARKAQQESPERVIKKAKFEKHQNGTRGRARGRGRPRGTRAVRTRGGDKRRRGRGVRGQETSTPSTSQRSSNPVPSIAALSTSGQSDLKQHSNGQQTPRKAKVSRRALNYGSESEISESEEDSSFPKFEPKMERFIFEDYMMLDDEDDKIKWESDDDDKCFNKDEKASGDENNDTMTHCDVQCKSPENVNKKPKLAKHLNETSGRARGKQARGARAMKSRGGDKRGRGRGVRGQGTPTPSTSQNTFQEVATASSMQQPSPPPSHNHPRQSLRNANIINFGSDADSNESDDEDGLNFPLIPRAYRATMRTPLDQDELAVGEDSDEEVRAPAPAPLAADAAECDPEATDRPWGLFEFDWKQFPDSPIPPESRRETFSQSNVGPTTPHADPYNIFCAIWDRQIMEHIASETNRYAQQVASRNLQPTSRIKQWKDTTSDELYLYFAMTLAMGVVVKTRLGEYWSATHDIFYTPGFSACMPINRFVLLSRCLHFANNDDMHALNLDVSGARLFKIQPLLSHLNSKFQSMYVPSRNIALDESLLKWKGWLEIGQVIPNKAANRGIKTYEICESRTGYLWRFEVHAHRSSDSRPLESDNPLEKPVPAIVLRLCQGLEHKGYTLWMDNYYNSPCLARRLKCLGFDCVGTLRTDRHYVPETLHNLTRRSMRPGQISGLTSGDVDVMVWRDSNRVAMISTYHGNAVRTTQGSTKPILILDYNIRMGGVDKKDQMLAMFPVERKRIKVWYKKLFKRLLNVSVLNSYIIHRHNTPSPSTPTLSHRDFRTTLIMSIISRHGSPSPIPSITILSGPAIAHNVPVNIDHRIDEYPMDEAGRQRLRRQCVCCKKRTSTFCVRCGKAVCIKPCFVSLHT